MKESMRKPVLFFMDLMVVFLAVILTIELIAIAGFTFPFMETLSQNIRIFKTDTGSGIPKMCRILL